MSTTTLESTQASTQARDGGRAGKDRPRPATDGTPDAPHRAPGAGPDPAPGSEADFTVILEYVTGELARLNRMMDQRPALTLSQPRYEAISRVRCAFDRMLRRMINDRLTVDTAIAVLCSAIDESIDALKQYCKRNRIKLDRIHLRAAFESRVPVLKDAWPWPDGAMTTDPIQQGYRIGHIIEDAERDMIESTLAHFNGHRAKTAEALGIGLRTLTMKLSQYREDDARRDADPAADADSPLVTVGQGDYAHNAAEDL